MSLQLGRSLEWGHARGMMVEDDEANRLPRLDYHAPWVDPEPTKV